MQFAEFVHARPAHLALWNLSMKPCPSRFMKIIYEALSIKSLFEDERIKRSHVIVLHNELPCPQKLSHLDMIFHHYLVKLSLKTLLNLCKLGLSIWPYAIYLCSPVHLAARKIFYVIVMKICLATKRCLVPSH